MIAKFVFDVVLPIILVVVCVLIVIGLGRIILSI